MRGSERQGGGYCCRLLGLIIFARDRPGAAVRSRLGVPAVIGRGSKSFHAAQRVWAPTSRPDAHNRKADHGRPNVGRRTSDYCMRYMREIRQGPTSPRLGPAPRVDLFCDVQFSDIDGRREDGASWEFGRRRRRCIAARRADENSAGGHRRRFEDDAGVLCRDSPPSCAPIRGPSKPQSRGARARKFGNSRAGRFAPKLHLNPQGLVRVFSSESFGGGSVPRHAPLQGQPRSTSRNPGNRVRIRTVRQKTAGMAPAVAGGGEGEGKKGPQPSLSPCRD